MPEKNTDFEKLKPLHLGKIIMTFVASGRHFTSHGIMATKCGCHNAVTLAYRALQVNGLFDNNTEKKKHFF